MRKFLDRGDPGTQPKCHIVEGLEIVAYSSTRVFMKRDAWEMLSPEGVLVQWIRPKGEEPWAIALTASELEQVFGEVRESASWGEARCYHFPQVPEAARSFRVMAASPIAEPPAARQRVVRRPRGSTARCYAILANYAVYDVEGASRTLTEDTWSLPRGEPRPDDQLVFWRTLGPDGKRGVVAFGRVTQEPRTMPVPPSSRRFW